jgi:predicted nucleic acid-binding protein
VTTDVFVDTRAWYALADAWDADHDTAQSANERLLAEGHGFVTTSSALDNAVVLIRCHIHRGAVVRFWHTLSQLVDGHLLELVRVTDSQERRA